MPQRTLLIIKPDAVRKNVIGEIIQRIESSGYRILNLRMVQLNREQAEIFYKVHHGREFYKPLIDFMCSGPCVPIVIEGENAIAGIRELIGATNPADSAEGTIRRDYATDGRRNAVHASDNPENADIEIAFFFNGKSDSSVLEKGPLYV